ncbi:MAG TPA: GtrA family protein [Candidatus Moranbacteria bacterium]|nr:GtrA family protein [Candidatus Moranbacteria bacterium]
MENTTQPMLKKDYYLSFLAGLLIGLLFLPILNAAKPELYGKISWFIIPIFFIGAPFGLAICHILSRKIPVLWQLGKFAVTGVLNVCVDLGTLSLLTFIFANYLGISAKNLVVTGVSFLTFYSLFKAASFIVANINSYFWNKHWTFHQEEDKKTEFFQFFIVSVVGFFINVFFASVVFKYVSPVAGLNLDQWGLIGAIIGSLAGLIWNFLGYKFIVFKK